MKIGTKVRINGHYEPRAEDGVVVGQGAENIVRVRFTANRTSLVHVNNLEIIE